MGYRDVRAACRAAGRAGSMRWGSPGSNPGSGPWPAGAVEIRFPASFVHGQTDDEGRQVEGGSELIYFQGQILLGGATPAPSGPADGQSKTKE